MNIFIPNRVLATLFSLFIAVPALAQGSAEVSVSGVDSSGNITVTVDMDGVTGGTVTGSCPSSGTVVLDKNSGQQQFELAAGETLTLTSSKIVGGKQLILTITHTENGEYTFEKGYHEVVGLGAGESADGPEIDDPA